MHAMRLSPVGEQVVTLMQWYYASRQGGLGTVT